MSVADSKRAMPFGDASTGSNVYQQTAPMQAAPDATDDAEFGPQQDDAHNWYASFRDGMGKVLGSIGVIPLCCCFPNPYQEVDQGFTGLVTRFGRFDREVPAGLVRVNPVSEGLHQVSRMVQLLDVPQQECMTKDNIKVNVTSVIYYKITDAKTATFKVARLPNNLNDLTTATLRDVAGRMTFQQLINDREAFATHTKEAVEDNAKSWGVHIESILLKDVIIDRALQDSLSMAAQSTRIGEAKVIAARAEVESARLMREAADILNSDAAMQIRYLEAMQAMAKTSGSKVIFMPGASNGFVEGSAPNVASPAMIAQQESLEHK